MITITLLKIGFWGALWIGVGIGLVVGIVGTFAALMWAADGINEDHHHHRRRYMP